MNDSNTFNPNNNNNNNNHRIPSNNKKITGNFTKATSATTSKKIKENQHEIKQKKPNDVETCCWLIKNNPNPDNNSKQHVDNSKNGVADSNCSKRSSSGKSLGRRKHNHQHNGAMMAKHNNKYDKLERQQCEEMLPEHGGGNESDASASSSSSATTIGSPPAEQHTSHTTFGLEDNNNVNGKENAANSKINTKRSTQKQHQNQNDTDQPNRPRTSTSEPIDDYNLNVRLRAIQQTQFPRNPQDYRASVDPYLLDEVTRNLYVQYSQSSAFVPNPIHFQLPRHQHHYSPSQPLKNYMNDNYMSSESLVASYHCPPPNLGSICSLNGGQHYGQHDSPTKSQQQQQQSTSTTSNNYHYMQPGMAWGQPSPMSQSYHHRYGNYANISFAPQAATPSTCCRMGCMDHYLTGNAGPYISPYGNHQAASQFYYDSHHNVPSLVNGHNNNTVINAAAAATLGSLCWENDMFTSSNNNTTYFNNNLSYPNLNTLTASYHQPQSLPTQNCYLSQMNLKKLMNNVKGANQTTAPSSSTDYLDSRSSPEMNQSNKTFYGMDKSSDDNSIQKQHSTGSAGSGTSGLGDEYQSLSQQPSQSPKAEKLIQLESVVNILRNQLLNTEELFKKALISKKTVENANCELLTIVDKLKLDLIHLESQQKLLKEQNIKLEDELETMRTRLLEKDTEISSLRLTMAKIVRTTGHALTDNELALLRGKTIASDFLKNKLKENYHEFSPFVRNNNTTSGTVVSNYFHSEPSSRRESSVGYCGRFSPIAPARSHHSPPVISEQPLSLPYQPKQSSPLLHNNKIINNQNLSQTLRSSSFEDMKMDSQQTDRDLNDKNGQVNKFNKNSPFSTLPHNTKAFRQVKRNLQEQEYSIQQQQQQNDANKAYSTPNSPMINIKPTVTSSAHQHYPQSQQNSFAVTFGKKFCWLRKSRRTASAPELAQDDEIIGPGQTMMRNNISPRINLDDTKPKGLRRIFSRKRSTSSLAGISDAFSRGGLRATSGPRLGFSVEKKFQNVNIPFSSWGTAMVADWFALIGLGMYVNDCKRWCRSGDHLMRATSVEVEKELGIKNSLHRKKLRLAVASMSNEEDDLLKCAGKLDYLWVARWLDDIGLPQYKESFIDARVDGRVLHYLTIEDLLHLKVTSQLHFASIRAAIRVLRENNYNGQCLKRRAAPEETNKIEWTADEVSVWSSHRIMEWLRSIDLSEYAPNLRGSGVHGALILYENAFNADLFATLLSIATSKTLLRRHISSKFKQLIGDELYRVKSDYERMPNYQPMIPGAKIRAHKKGHFTLRKKRADFELTDYVCPMTSSTSTNPSAVAIQISKYIAFNRNNILRDSPISQSSNSTVKKKEDSPNSLKTTDSDGKNSNKIEQERDTSSLKSNKSNKSCEVQIKDETKQNDESKQDKECC